MGLQHVSDPKRLQLHAPPHSPNLPLTLRSPLLNATSSLRTSPPPSATSSLRASSTSKRHLLTQRFLRLSAQLLLTSLRDARLATVRWLGGGPKTPGGDLRARNSLPH